MPSGVTPGAGPHRRAAVLGHPVAHSLSPVLHRAAYAELGLEWTYDAIDVTSSKLPEFVGGLTREWVGLSLTMPLKESVLPLLDQVAPDAAQVRAANTVVLDATGLRGFNTDIAGLVGLLSAAGFASGGRQSGGARADAVVLGSGATARSTVAALAASEVRHVAVSARRPEAAADVAAVAEQLGVSARMLPWPPPAAELSCAVVVSTVPADATADFVLASNPGLLVDVIYDPWPTPLASAWSDAGGQVVGGFELLVRQAFEQVVLFTGRRPDIDGMRTAGQQVLDERAGRGHIAQAEQ
ncbi:MAG: shikimate dehydrogenase [Actinomycetes bacterium]